MATKIRLGIVGLGRMGEKYLKELKSSSMAHIVAACSTNSESSCQVAEKYRIPQLLHSLSEMLATVDVDGVIIASPPAFHFEQAMECVTSGKHVLLEKPVCVSEDQVAQLISSAKLSQKSILAQPFFDTSSMRRSKKLLLHGNLGKPVMAECILCHNYLKPPSWFFSKARFGGVTYDLIIYGVTFLCYLYGEPKEISFWEQMQGSSSQTPPENGAEVVAAGMLRYESGMIALLRASACSPFQWSMRVLYQRGGLSVISPDDTLLFADSPYRHFRLFFQWLVFRLRPSLQHGGLRKWLDSIRNGVADTSSLALQEAVLRTLGRMKRAGEVKAAVSGQSANCTRQEPIRAAHESIRHL